MASSHLQPDPHQNLYVIQDHCFETGTVTKYVKGSFLGKGGFARCYELINEAEHTLEAVKIIQKSSLVKQRSKIKLMSEINIHKSLDHKNVVRFLHNFEDNLNVYMVLELCPNKTLNDMIKKKRKFSEQEAKYFVIQVLDALEYLHSQKIIHRDLKLGNLFLGQGMTVKVGDFGLASKLQFVGEKRRTICGTPNYIAPEILESKGHSYEVDIWSLGVIMYTLVCGRPPFESKDVKETYRKIKDCNFNFPEQPALSPHFKKLVSSILVHEPHRRPSIQELRCFDFFTETPLSRQPSVSLTQRSCSANKDERDLSDNGKLYTNNEIYSRDICQKSQERFLATERTSSTSKMTSNYKDIGRANSHRVLKDSSQNNLERTPPRKISLENRKSAIESVTVKKWIDYSSKYGIGYTLSNGMIGVYFNDSTKILSSGDDYFFYIERIDRQEIARRHQMREYPPQLKKKVSLFSHFKGYLVTGNENGGSPRPYDEKKLVYVRRWFRSRHAVIFRLSNKSVQVIFIDQSELLIDSLSKKVLFTSKHKDKQELQLADIMHSGNRELIKRFQYTKEVLNEMATNMENRKSTA